jgi:hypothetical protein
MTPTTECMEILAQNLGLHPEVVFGVSERPQTAAMQRCLCLELAAPAGPDCRVDKTNPDHMTPSKTSAGIGYR